MCSDLDQSQDLLVGKPNALANELPMLGPYTETTRDFIKVT